MSRRLSLGYPYGVVTNVLDCDMQVSDFEHHAITLTSGLISTRKIWTFSSPEIWFQLCDYCHFTWLVWALNNTWRLMCHLTMNPKSNIDFRFDPFFLSSVLRFFSGYIVLSFRSWCFHTFRSLPLCFPFFNNPISFWFAPSFKISWLGTTNIFRHTP